jgi:hypothetical protein
VRDDEAACWPRTIVVSAEASRASVPKAAEPTDTNGSADYLPHPLSASDLEVMRRLNRRHLQFPFGFFYQAVVLVASVESPTVNVGISARSQLPLRPILEANSAARPRASRQ